MQLTRWFPVLFVLAALFGCGGDHSSDVLIEQIDGVTYVRNGAAIDTTAFPFELILEQSFGAEEEPFEATLTHVRNLAVDEDANVYILDSGHGHLVSFDRDGRFRWTAGSPGEAPGEFSGTTGIIYNQEGLLISNGFGARLDRWDLSGKFLDSKALPQGAGPWATVIGVRDSGQLVFSGHMPGQIGSRISVIDPQSLTIDDSLSVIQTIEAPNSDLFYSPLDVLVDEGSVFFGTASGEYQFRIIELDSGTERIVSRDVHLLHRPVVVTGDGGYGVFNFSQFKVLGSLSSGQSLTHVSSAWIDDVEEYARSMSAGSASDLNHFSSLDAFDSEGRYLGSKWWDDETPAIGQIITIAPDGKLYTFVTSPYPQIRRYRLESR